MPGLAQIIGELVASTAVAAALVVQIRMFLPETGKRKATREEIPD